MEKPVIHRGVAEVTAKALKLSLKMPQPAPKPSLTELAEQLQLALESARTENEQLIAQIREAEARAAEADARSREIEQKLEKLEALKTKEYQTVVTELFEGPSQKAAHLTLRVAVLSIAIGLIQTLGFNVYSARTKRADEAALRDLINARFAEELKRSETNTKLEIKQYIKDALDQEDRHTTLWITGAIPQLSRNTPTRITVAETDVFFQVAVPLGTSSLSVKLSPHHQRFGPNSPLQRVTGTKSCQGFER